MLSHSARPSPFSGSRFLGAMARDESAGVREACFPAMRVLFILS